MSRSSVKCRQVYKVVCNNRATSRSNSNSINLNSPMERNRVRSTVLKVAPSKHPPSTPPLLKPRLQLAPMAKRSRPCHRRNARVGPTTLSLLILQLCRTQSLSCVSTRTISHHLNRWPQQRRPTNHGRATRRCPSGQLLPPLQLRSRL